MSVRVALDALLPPAAPDAALDLRATSPSGEAVRVVRRDEALHVGEVALPLDGGLDATLAWAQPARDRLLLELDHVRSATERTQVTLACPAEALPAWRDAALIARQPGAAPVLEADAMLALLGLVRGCRESHAQGRELAWSPAGELAWVYPCLPMPFTPLRGWDLRDAPDLRLVESSPAGAVVAVAERLDAETHAGRIFLHMLVGFTLGGPVVLAGLSVLVFGTVGLGVILPGVLLGLLLSFALARRVAQTRPAVKAWVPAVRVLPDRIEVIDGATIARPEGVRARVPAAPDAPLHLIDRDGASTRVHLPGASAQVWHRLIARAWQLGEPTA